MADKAGPHAMRGAPALLLACLGGACLWATAGPAGAGFAAPGAGDRRLRGAPDGPARGAPSRAGLRRGAPAAPTAGAGAAAAGAGAAAAAAAAAALAAAAAARRGAARPGAPAAAVAASAAPLGSGAALRAEALGAAPPPALLCGAAPQQAPPGAAGRGGAGPAGAGRRELTTTARRVIAPYRPRESTNPEAWKYKRINPRYLVSPYCEPSKEKQEYKRKMLNFFRKYPTYCRVPNAMDRRWFLWRSYVFKHNLNINDRKSFRRIRERVIRFLKKQMRQRWVERREYRHIWLHRLDALAQKHGIDAYPWWHDRRREDKIMLDAKVLTEIGLIDRPVFSAIVQATVPDWRDQLAEKLTPPKELTNDEVDEKVLPWIEDRFPELYADGNIRFNRKAHEWGVEYTVDMGNPDSWRKILAETPELANWQVPDHWLKNPNAIVEDLPMEYLGLPAENQPVPVKRMKRQVEELKEQDGVNAEAGQPVWPTREGVSREDWFKEDGQSWA